MDGLRELAVILFIVVTGLTGGWLLVQIGRVDE